MRLTSTAPPPDLPLAAALFLDIDGTLVPFAARPQDVIVANWVVPTLAAVGRALHGALAIVSGRPLGGIDALLQPLTLPAAGAHGVERRDALGRVVRFEAVPPRAVMACAARLVAQHARLLLECKPGGLALHFRAAPELGTVCRLALASALASESGALARWELLDGHSVCELKQRVVSKGTAVQAFLAEPTFAQRVPVFVGDDLTDEDGIRVVQDAGGFGIRVGPGATQAHYRLPDVDAVARWLRVAVRSAVPADELRRHA